MLTAQGWSGSWQAAIEEALQALQGRVAQAIALAGGDIKGYLALVPDIELPPETLHAACMDMALYRLFEHLPEESVIKQLNDARHSFFDRLITGKAAVNREGGGSAQTAAPDSVFTAETLEAW